MSRSLLAAKQKEFVAWLADTRGISQEASVPKSDLMELFSTFCEDYNTCTLPGGDKYYDLDAWENAERARTLGSGAAAGGDDGAYDMLRDAAQRRAERAKATAASERALLEMYRAGLGDSGARKADLQRQADLQARMQYAYRAGDTAQAERIKKMLEPMP